MLLTEKFCNLLQDGYSTDYQSKPIKITGTSDNEMLRKEMKEEGAIQKAEDTINGITIPSSVTT